MPQTNLYDPRCFHGMEVMSYLTTVANFFIFPSLSLISSKKDLELNAGHLVGSAFVFSHLFVLASTLASRGLSTLAGGEVESPCSPKSYSSTKKMLRFGSLSTIFFFSELPLKITTDDHNDCDGDNTQCTAANFEVGEEFSAINSPASCLL